MRYDLHGLIVASTSLSARHAPDQARPADITLLPWVCDVARFDQLARLAATLPPLLGSPPAGRAAQPRRTCVVSHEGRWLILMADRVLFDFEPATGQLHRLVRDHGDTGFGEDIQCGSYWATHAALQGRTPLHASALDLPDEAGCLLIAAASGQGKSSTAASLALAGARIRSDDVVTLQAHETGWQAEAGSLTLRMRQTLNAALPEHLSENGQSSDGRYLYQGSPDLPSTRHMRGLLFPRLDAEATAISLVRMPALEAFRALAEEPRVFSYDKSWQNRRVGLLSGLVARLPAWQVTLPNRQRDLAQQGPILMALLRQALDDATS